MAALVAGRSAIMRTLRRASTNSFPVPPRSSNSIPHRTPMAHPHHLRLTRRELSTFKPIHSAIASSCLVSKLPVESNSPAEGRFANYLSPI